MMGLDGKDRKLLVAASITASLTGDLRWIALTNRLPKGINARHQALVLLVGVGHRRRLLMAFASLLLDERPKQSVRHLRSCTKQGHAVWEKSSLAWSLTETQPLSK